MKLSIIIPLYNNEKYISRCLDSIICMKQIEWECIIIDDGSSDKSGEIADIYSSEDCRFRSIHINNGGVSNARNRGMQEAKGDAILFVDSDDWFLDDAEKNLIEALPLVNNGISTFFGHVKIYEAGKQEIKPMPEVNSLEYSEIIKELVVKRQKLNNCWGVLFCNNIIKNNNIQFDVSMKVGEDACFVLEYLKYCKRIVPTHKLLIAYWNNNNGAMHKTGIETIKDDEKCFNKRKELLQELDISLTSKEFGIMCNYHFSNFIGYLSSESKKISIKALYILIKRYSNTSYFKELISNIDMGSLSKAKRILVKCFLVKAYWITCVLIKIYSINNVKVNN